MKKNNKKITGVLAKPGHQEVIGETIAKLRLFEKGINTYSRFLDVDAVDFVIRSRKRKKINYKEIQMKYSKYHKKSNGYWFGINKKSFEYRDNFYFMFICGEIGNIFIIPSKKLKNFIRKFNSDKVKWHVFIKERKNMWYFSTKKEYDDINITEYRNQFEILR